MKSWAAKVLKDGFKLTAGEHLIRAAIYYHFAKFVFVQDLKQMRAAHMKAVECYRDGVAHARPPGERVEMPYRESILRRIEETRI